MSHYFKDDPNLASNIKEIKFEVNGLIMNLFTDNGVFSKGKVDEGSLAFLKVLLPLDLGKNILDLGCGYGTLGLTLAVTLAITTVSPYLTQHEPLDKPHVFPVSTTSGLPANVVSNFL